ncbi:MAG: energy-coupled thiamine transporter ThiT [Lachnospiraceae bacterium]|nr:energy-coupled thiamine transporter ThiT [Lachnospiraceae bacterium]
MSKEKTFNAKALAFSGVALALATVISVFIKLPSLPFGGSVTLFSMLVVCLIGYCYGPVVGITAAVAYGVLQFITQPYVVHPLQVVLDFPLAFGALGLSGLFHNTKNGLIKGYCIGVLGRFIVHCISGVIFYTEYVGSFGGNVAAIWTGILYNMTYIVPEFAATLILLAIPAVRKAITQFRQMATS